VLHVLQPSTKSGIFAGGMIGSMGVLCRDAGTDSSQTQVMAEMIWQEGSTALTSHKGALHCKEERQAGPLMLVPAGFLPLPGACQLSPSRTSTHEEHMSTVYASVLSAHAWHPRPQKLPNWSGGDRELWACKDIGHSSKVGRLLVGSKHRCRGNGNSWACGLGGSCMWMPRWLPRSALCTTHLETRVAALGVVALRQSVKHGGLIETIKPADTFACNASPGGGQHGRPACQQYLTLSEHVAHPSTHGCIWSSGNGATGNSLTQFVQFVEVSPCGGADGAKMAAYAEEAVVPNCV